MSVVKDNVCSSSLKRFLWISKWYWLAWNPRRCWHLFSLGGEWWMPGLASKHKGHCYERAAREKAVAGGWCPRRLGLHRFYQRMLRCSHCNSLMEKNWRAQLELEEVVVPVVAWLVSGRSRKGDLEILSRMFWLLPITLQHRRRLLKGAGRRIYFSNCFNCPTSEWPRFNDFM